MNQSIQNEQITKTGNWIAARLEKTEAILFTVLILSLILRIATSFPAGILLNVTLMSLAICYFLNAFAEIDDEYAGSIELFLNKLGSWACSIGTIGILFTIEKWNNSRLFLMVGGFTLILVVAGILYIKSKKPELKFFNSRYMLRIVVICVVGLVLAFAPINL